LVKGVECCTQVRDTPGPCFSRTEQKSERSRLTGTTGEMR
jgi:hypothetical protein